jgi:hypothetical protein
MVLRATGIVDARGTLKDKGVLAPRRAPSANRPGFSVSLRSVVDPRQEGLAGDEAFPDLEVADIGTLDLLDQHQTFPEAQLEAGLAFEHKVEASDVEYRAFLSHFPHPFPERSGE